MLPSILQLIDALVVNKFNNFFGHDYILISVFFLAASIMQYKEDTLDFIESFLGNLSIWKQQFRWSLRSIRRGERIRPHFPTMRFRRKT